MAEWRMQGMEDFVNLCIFTDRQLARVCGKSLHPGAKIMADAIRTAVESIPVDDTLFAFSTKYGRKRRGITSRQKQALWDSLGVASMRQTRWGWNVKIGFDGYNDIVSERWPKGQPNAMIARSVNSGTSFLEKYPYMDTTVAKYELTTVEAIEEEFYKQLEKIWDK